MLRIGKGILLFLRVGDWTLVFFEGCWRLGGGGVGIKFEGESQLFIGQAPKQECVSPCSCHYMSFNLTNSPSQVLALIITYI